MAITPYGRAPVLLEEGHFALMPAARGFTVASVDPVLPNGQFSKPVSIAPGQVRIGDPALPVSAQLLVGHCTFGTRDAGLLLTLLPNLVVIRGEERLAMLIRLVADEARATCICPSPCVPCTPILPGAGQPRRWPAPQACRAPPSSPGSSARSAVRLWPI
ncbi:cupin domain-containing protein [Paracoccus liaowanqingii]|uniref:cupin domain-containing protein n=1 Tax=Paracoccus liaowanqingii TaxID=2560053 RepID=UPI0034DFC396